MKVANNKVTAISYELTVEGKVADKASADKPLEYIHGTGMLLPKFEMELEGKEEGDSFAFTLTPEEGYGQVDPRYVVEIPKTAFMVEGMLREDLLKEGNVIPMMNSDGHVVQGTVAGIGEDTVKMDFNHPMAGKTLNFTGRIESVREATKKELEEGLHGEYLPTDGECGCEGGCHNGNCEGEGGCHNGEGECCGHHKGKCCHEGK